MKKLLPLAASIIILSGTACEEEGGPLPPPPPPGPRNTPAEVLKTVEISFNQREIEILKKSLSPDFVFYFNPDDVGQNPPGGHYIIPPSWSYDEFQQVAGNMFTKAYSISLTIPAGNVGTPGENETKYKADDISIHLVVMVGEIEGYLADRGYCDYEFQIYVAENGGKYWRLTKWWDRTSAEWYDRPGVARTSLGRILAMYH